MTCRKRWTSMTWNEHETWTRMTCRYEDLRMSVTRAADVRCNESLPVGIKIGAGGLPLLSLIWTFFCRSLYSKLMLYCMNPEFLCVYTNVSPCWGWEIDCPTSTCPTNRQSHNDTLISAPTPTLEHEVYEYLAGKQIPPVIIMHGFSLEQSLWEERS